MLALRFPVIQSVSYGRDAGLLFEVVSVEGFRMERFSYAALIGGVFFAMGSLGHADDPGKKHHKYQKVQEWLSLLSDADRAKLRAAKEQALKDPTVQAANQRRKQADTEYHDLLDKEMLKTDPSLEPLLDAITDLKKRADD